MNYRLFPVIAEPPYFIESPMAIVKKAEGQEVILTCRVFGAPKPTVTWFRGTPAKEVVGPRFTTLPEGDLKIVSAVREDATTYTCLARNKFGEEQASGQLLIRGEWEYSWGYAAVNDAYYMGKLLLFCIIG